MSVEVNLFMFFYGALLLISQCAGFRSEGGSFPLKRSGERMPVLTSKSGVEFSIPRRGNIEMRPNKVRKIESPGRDNSLVDRGSFPLKRSGERMPVLTSKSGVEFSIPRRGNIEMRPNKVRNIESPVRDNSLVDKCSFPLKRSGELMPVLTSTSGVEFIIPYEGNIRMKRNEVIHIACPGRNNRLVDRKEFRCDIRKFPFIHGEQAQLKCGFSSSNEDLDRVEFQWERENNAAWPKNEQKDGTLVIDKVEQSAQGLYICSVKTSEGQLLYKLFALLDVSRCFFLLKQSGDLVPVLTSKSGVEFIIPQKGNIVMTEIGSRTDVKSGAFAPKEFRQDIRKFTVFNGGKARLKCDFTSSNKNDVKFKWVRENKAPLQRDEQKVLVIDNVEQSAQGLYICYAKTSRGQLLYKLFALLDVIPKEFPVPEGKQATLKFDFPPSNKDDVKCEWVRENNAALPKNKQIDGALVIDNVEQSAQGLYICKMKRLRQEYQMRALLNVIPNDERTSREQSSEQPHSVISSKLNSFPKASFFLALFFSDIICFKDIVTRQEWQLASGRANSYPITCVKDRRIQISNEATNFEEKVCKSIPRGSVENTDKKCGPAGGGGSIINIGFQLPHKKFKTLIEICYDSVKGNTLYSRHEVIGREFDYIPKRTFKRPPFSPEGLNPKLDAASNYERNSEKSAFDILLKNKTLTNKYISATSYLAKGHLSPVCDFILDSWKAASFFFLNSVPQWQVINNSNWKRLENMVREAAKFYAEDLQVLTGGHETLVLKDGKNQETKIHLDAGQSMLAVPKYMWKIVFSENSKNAVAFVVLNNPFAVSLGTNDILCTDICSQYGWDKPEWKNGKNGFIYCCDAHTLLTIVSGPQMDIRGVLDGRNVKKNGPINSAC